MKKYLLLLLITAVSYGQTYQNPTFGTITTKTAPTSTTDPYVSSMNANGVIGKVAPENIPVNVIPPTTHYTPTSPTLKGHFQGLDNAIGNIPLTTAGNTTRIWFTGDATTITAGTFYLTNATNKGTVANVSQSVTNDDNQKKYFTQDLIGQPFAAATLFPPGVYAGNLSASTTPNSAQQRFTVELYKCNNAGTPIASGVSGAPVGDLGVTVILILDSGLLTLADGSVTNVPVSASLASQLSVAVGERIRYHVSAEKVGTASSNITESVWYGNSFNSFIDVPTPITSNGVSNVSTVTGATLTNALDNLNISKENSANKQNSLATDGTGVKFPTVDAVSGGTAYKRTIAQIRALSGTLPNTNFYTTDLGQEGNWYYDASDASSLDNTGTVLVTADGKRIKRIFQEVVNVKWFGAKGDATDQTAKIQNALNVLDSKGGGTLFIPNGIYYVSIAGSSHANACMIIPKNVRVSGESKKATVIQRLPSERGVDGVLICNKNYDLITDYLADGNIIIENLTVTDGAVSPNRGLGDLIGFGNGDGLIVQNCYFGNHDQHAVDVAKSRNVHIRLNESENKVLASASATYQIDAGLIWGIFGPSKSSENVYIYDNNILESHANNIIHFHTANVSKNCFIYRNNINGNFLGAGQNAIGGDTDIHYDNVHISENTISLNNAETRAINFPSLHTCLIKGLKIYNNTIKGVFRTAVFSGDDLSVITQQDNTPLEDIEIYNNNIYPTAINIDFSLLSGGAGRYIAVSRFNRARIANNTIFCNFSGSTGIKVIEDNECQNIDISGNLIKSTKESTAIGTNVVPIYSKMALQITNNIPKRFNIKDNTISISGVKYHIEFDDNLVSGVNTYNKFSGSVSRNTFNGSSITSDIFEIVPLSDGTNNLKFIDFTGLGNLTDYPYVLPVAKATSYLNIPLPGRKKSRTADRRTGNITITILFSPTSTGFNNAEYPINNSLTSTNTAIGVFVRDIDVTSGNFDLIGGNSGITFNLDNTGVPTIVNSGYIKVLCGI